MLMNYDCDKTMTVCERSPDSTSQYGNFRAL